MKKLTAIVLSLVMVLSLGTMTAFAASGSNPVNNTGSQTYVVNPDRGDWTQTQVKEENGYTYVYYVNVFRTSTDAGAISEARKYADQEMNEIIEYAKNRGWTVDEPSKDPDSQYATSAKTALYFWYHWYDANGSRHKKYFSFIQEVTTNNGKLTSSWSQAKNGSIVMTGISTATIKEVLEQYKP